MIISCLRTYTHEDIYKTERIMQAIPHVYRSQEERDQNKGLSFASVHKYLKHQKPSFPVAKKHIVFDQKILLDLFRSLENVNAQQKLTEDR